jgi:hypothetical protein
MTSRCNAQFGIRPFKENIKGHGRVKKDIWKLMTQWQTTADQIPFWEWGDDWNDDEDDANPVNKEPQYEHMN